MNYERILLMLTIIEKAAACGVNHMPFVSVAVRELGELSFIPSEPISPPPVDYYDDTLEGA